MTVDTFTHEFDRLCRGFRYEATMEQYDAWYARLKHWDDADWREAVSVLLCGSRFPRLAEVVTALERAQAARRAAEEARRRAELRTPRGAATPSPVAPCHLAAHLLTIIMTIARREQVRRQRDLVQSGREYRQRPEVARHAEVARLDDVAQQLTDELARLLPLLDDTELTEVMARYGETILSG